MPIGPRIGPRVGPWVGPRVGAPAGGAAALAVTKDAVSNVYAPADSTEWDAVFAAAGLSGVSASFGWGMQDAATPLTASVGAVALSANGTGSYQQPVAGWDRDAVALADNGSAYWFSNSASLPDLSATSALLILYWQPPASNPAAVRRVASVGTTGIIAQVDTAGKVKTFHGANTATGTNAVTGGGVIPLVLKSDRANSQATVYTLADRISPAWSASVTGKQVIVGGTSATAASKFLLGALLTGTSAELSHAQVKTLLQTLNWSPSFAT